MTPTTPAAEGDCKRGPMRPLIFFREDGWYPLELPDDDNLGAHAECNPGTLKIVCALTGETLWRPQ